MLGWMKLQVNPEGECQVTHTKHNVLGLFGMRGLLRSFSGKCLAKVLNQVGGIFQSHGNANRAGFDSRSGEFLPTHFVMRGE
jgi:hypothetical protein